MAPSAEALTPRAARQLGVCVHGVVAAGCLAYVVLGRSLPHVDAWWLSSFGALLTVSAVAHVARVRAAGVSTLDASFAVELCALVVVGPLGAFLVAFLPAFALRVIRRHMVFSDRSMADLAAIACECVVGSVVLTTAPGPLTALSAVPAVFTAGVGMLFAGYVVGPAFMGMLRHGRPDFRPFFQALAPELGIVLCGVVITLATGPLGVLALAGFLVAVPLPSLVVGELTRFKAADRVDRDAARRAYARALADELRLSRGERQALEGALEVIAGTVPARLPAATVDVTEAVLHLDERWDGAGGVAGLAGEWIPRVARVVAVADAWSGLTAAGTVRIGHAEALLGLAAASGTLFDPEVVDAAQRVIAVEAPYARQPAFVPRLHAVPLPRSVRRGPLPRLLQVVAGD